MKILIIANARWRGGLSGSDAIYESFKKYWNAEITIWEMQNIDFRPFALCYTLRIIFGITRAVFHFRKYDIVYSASDFLMDSLPAWIMKIKGMKWIAGFYLFAPKDKFIYYHSQKIAFFLIKKFADMVIVTNPSMLMPFFPLKMTWINGGIDTSLIKKDCVHKVFDCVFCGRIHHTKGIVELLEAWHKVRERKADAKLAVIGDGDLGISYIKKLNPHYKECGITLFGYMGKERFKVYEKSKIVLYPTPKRYEHFSMAPIEAMACGCPLIAFNLDVFKIMNPDGCIHQAETIKQFVNDIVYLLDDMQAYNMLSYAAEKYALQFNYKDQALRVFNDIKGALKL